MKLVNIKFLQFTFVFYRQEAYLHVEPKVIKLEDDGKRETKPRKFQKAQKAIKKKGFGFFEMLMQKNVSLYSEAEIQFLLSFKERQYAVRRERIKDYCSVQDDPLFGMKIDTLIYNPVDRVSYCPIAKVASSTWCNHFIKLGITTDILLTLHRSKSLFCIIIKFFLQPM